MGTAAAAASSATSSTAGIAGTSTSRMLSRSVTQSEVVILIVGVDWSLELDCLDLPWSSKLGKMTKLYRGESKARTSLGTLPLAPPTENLQLVASAKRRQSKKPAQEAKKRSFIRRRLPPLHCQRLPMPATDRQAKRAAQSRRVQWQGGEMNMH